MLRMLVPSRRNHNPLLLPLLIAAIFISLIMEYYSTAGAALYRKNICLFWSAVDTAIVNISKVSVAISFAPFILLSRVSPAL